MVSEHLLAERDRLLAAIDNLRASGAIAPDGVRIEPDFLNPKCWLLTHTNLPMKERRLGQSASPQYHDWVERIHRRDQLQELEQQLTLVQGLIDRQNKSENVFLPTVDEIDNGDLVEVDGQKHRVVDVGLRYLKIVDDQGKVHRCEIEKARLVKKAVGV